MTLQGRDRNGPRHPQTRRPWTASPAATRCATRKAIYLHYIKNLLDRGDAAYQLTPTALAKPSCKGACACSTCWARGRISCPGGPLDAHDPQSPERFHQPRLRAHEQRLIAQDQQREQRRGHDGHCTALPSRRCTCAPSAHDAEPGDLDSDHLRLPINQHLVHTWDIAESRLANLRNNRTLDGKPLSPPLFAAPSTLATCWRPTARAWPVAAVPGCWPRMCRTTAFHVMHNRGTRGGPDPVRPKPGCR